MIIKRMRWWDIPAVDMIEETLFPHDHWSVDQWWRELATPHNHYWVGELEDRIIGYAGLSVQSPDADIQTMAIKTSMQGNGYGGQLLDHMLEAAAELSVKQIFLEVREDNTAAIALYVSRGFQKISVRRNYYPDGTTAVIMRREQVPRVGER